MTEFDPSQARALALDPERHARIVGAPGTGKTRVLVEAFARALERFGESGVLALAPNRMVTSELRARIERAVGRALGGTPVRTPAAFGFAVLTRAAALEGTTPPRLLTGTAQDEFIAEVVAEMIERGEHPVSGLPAEVAQTAPFRAEIREFWRVIDDFGLPPEDLAARLRPVASGSREAFSDAPGDELLTRWEDALRVIARAEARRSAARADELAASALQRAASALIRGDGGAGTGVPRLLLVDDAQDLGEGALALLAACAAAGSAVWVFGDPDIATGAFHGEGTAVLSHLSAELSRRGAAAEREQSVVLETVHRQSPPLRRLVADLTSRIGAAGLGEQRGAQSGRIVRPPAAELEGGTRAGASSAAAASGDDGRVQFVAVDSPAEQLGVVAHRLRARSLGLDGEDPVPWGRMAVICRSRSEAKRVARSLAAHQVPVGVAAGGVILRDHPIARELIRLLQHALGLEPLGADELLELVGGVVGGLDPVALRRLRGTLLLDERRAAREAGRSPRDVREVVSEAAAMPGSGPIVDSAGGRALHRVSRIAAAGRLEHENGGTPREVLWAIWARAGLAEQWQTAALDGRGARADEASRALDAVLGLFFALQRHEEQVSPQPVAELLQELLTSAVPEDTLAPQSGRRTVTVTTPQGVIGREFELVAIIGVQDGSWPNLRPRGSLLGGAALERWLRGGEALAPSRKDTLHDELRLFAHSCARARGELLVVAVADEDQHPSAFFELGRAHRVAHLPSNRLTLRGLTAQLRRRTTADPSDGAALDALAALAAAGVTGAHPDDWYGVLPPSTDAPLVDLAGDPDARVSLSPSQLERAEDCPLDWVIARLGAGSGGVEASLGTLIHHAFELAHSPDPEAMLRDVQHEWGKLPFDAEWESERSRRTASEMVAGLAEYLREFAGSDRTLLAREARFTVEIGRAVLHGIADRLEARTAGDGGSEVTVLDLKTGRTPPSGAEAEQHAQLQAYQLGILEGAFVLPAAPGDTDAGGVDPGSVDAGNTGVGGADVGNPDAGAPVAIASSRSGGARLLFVHPDATKGRGFVERAQQPLSDEARDAFVRRVAEVAQTCAAASFTARVEHHCSDPYHPGNCRIHIIPAVSHA